MRQQKNYSSLKRNNMVLELSQMFTHTPCSADGKKYSEEELKAIILKLMKDSGIDPNGVNVNEDGCLQVEGNTNIKLHGLMLRAEEHGLKMKYTKKTLIEFC